MSSNKKTIQIILLCCAIMAAVIYWLTSSSSVPPLEKAAPPPKVADRELKNSTLEESKDGKKSWELTVASLIYDTKKEGATLKGIKGKFYAEDGREMTITADEGTVNLVTKDIVLTKNPYGTTSDQGTIKADKITWLNKTRMVLAEGHVHITKDDVVATAQKASLDVAINKAKLEQAAKVTKGVKR